MGTAVNWLFAMVIVKRLIALHKLRGVAQQGLVDAIDLLVDQIKRYEAGAAQHIFETFGSLILKYNVRRAFANDVRQTS